MDNYGKNDLRKACKFISQNTNITKLIFRNIYETEIILFPFIFFTSVLLTVFQTAETADSVLRHKYFQVIKFCLKLILHGSAPKRQNSAVKPWGMILLFLKTLISGNPKKGGQNMCLMTANMKMLLY